MMLTPSGGESSCPWTMLSYSREPFASFLLFFQGGKPLKFLTKGGNQKEISLFLYAARL